MPQPYEIDHDAPKDLAWASDSIFALDNRLTDVESRVSALETVAGSNGPSDSIQVIDGRLIDLVSRVSALETVAGKSPSDSQSLSDRVTALEKVIAE